MPGFYPNEGCIAIASAMVTWMDEGHIRLFQSSFTPSIGSKQADFEAAECDFTGYPTAGIELPAFLAPLLNPLGGAGIEMPTQQFAAASPYTVANMVGGFWLENHAGDTVLYAYQFDTPIPVGTAGQGIPISGVLVFPNGIG